MGWITGPNSIAQGRGRETARGVTLPSFSVPVEYRSLHKYLAERYADIVVLTFAQMEDLLGFTLPQSARAQPEWWSDGDEDVARSPQARAWTLADRTATPNLTARTVMFERVRV
jgi:hypothetical protein